MTALSEQPRWHERARGDTQEVLKETVTQVMQADRGRLEELARLYLLFNERRGLFGGHGLGLPKALARMGKNVLRTLVRTHQARLLANRPRPFYCSDGGAFDLRHQLEQLNEGVSGLFLATGADQKVSLAVLHAVLGGAGAVRVYRGPGRPEVERVYPWEVFVDALDGLYGNPRCLYLVRWVDRAVLLAKYPKKRREIMAAATDRVDWATWTKTLGEPVRVMEAWHLPDEQGQGGRHVIAIDTVTLRDEEHKRRRFPVLIYRHSDATEGYWPQGLGQDLHGPQIELNRLTDMRREIIHRCSRPMLVLTDSSKIPSAVLDNVVGAIVRTHDRAPQYVTGQGLTVEVNAAIADTVSWMFQTSGTSESMATGTKPAGLNSGRALRVFADQVDGRQRDPSEKLQDFYCHLGQALVDEMRDIAADNPEAALTFTDPKKKSVATLRWADIDVSDAELELICQPISALPSTPAARAAALEEMFNAKVLTIDEYREALDLPDLDALQAPQKAPRRYIEKLLDGMVNDGTPADPEPFLPLALAVQMATQRYCQASLDGCPEERLELVRQFITDCTDRATQPASAPPAGAAQPGDPAAPLDPTQAPPANDAGPQAMPMEPAA